MYTFNVMGMLHYIHVHVYVYVHIHVHVYVYVHIHVHVCVSMGKEKQWNCGIAGMVILCTQISIVHMYMYL